MKRKTITLTVKNDMTLEKGFNEFITYCKNRGFRKDTIRHYTGGYTNLIKYVDRDIQIEDINKDIINGFINWVMDKDISSNTKFIYIKDFQRIMNYFVEQEYIEKVKITPPRIDKKPKEIYTDTELKKMLLKPNIKKCNFTEYKTWVIISFLMSTGLRLSSFTNIKIKDIDLDNEVVYVKHTKNRKSLIVPLNFTIVDILKEYLKYRKTDSNEDYLFCNIYGKQLSKACITNTIVRYNLKRDVNSRGIHKFRHTFATKFIQQGGSVVVLQKVLGNSSLQVTQNYINILITDVKKDIDKFNVLQQFNNETIKLNK